MSTVTHSEVGNPDSMLPPMALPNRKISWFVYVVRLSSRFREFHRDRIVNEMKFREIALGEVLCADSPTASLSIVRRREGYSACDGVSRRLWCARALPFFNRIQEKEIKEGSAER